MKIAETEYVNPENEAECIKLIICAPNVSFDSTKLEAKYGHLNKDKVNFVSDLKSFIYAHSSEALRKKVEANGGTLRFRLNEQDVEITLGQELFFNALDLAKQTGTDHE